MIFNFFQTNSEVIKKKIAIPGLGFDAAEVALDGVMYKRVLDTGQYTSASRQRVGGDRFDNSGTEPFFISLQFER